VPRIPRQHIIKKQEEKKMGWLAWIILGGVAGWIASMITHARMGLIVDIIAGIVGAFLGSFILKLFGVQEILAFNFNTLLVAIGGAIVVLFVLHLFRARN
jgi:uncharacterized membrane protein YeaQ/YmgE (transglycosylase-associated protein family)